MRRFYLLLPTLLLNMTMFAQDACYKVYLEALQDYSKSNYIEAQRKFVVVAQTCGDYSDVWSKLKSCNQKIAERERKHTTEISSLQKGKQQVETEMNSLLQQLAEKAGEISGLQSVINHNRDSLTAVTIMWRDSLSNVNLRLDSVSTLLDSANVQIKMLQEKLIEIESTSSRRRRGR